MKAIHLRVRERQPPEDIYSNVRCRNQGRCRSLRVPIYDWFTEGFATADLEEAQALLDQLS